MTTVRLRNRSRLRRKEVAQLADALTAPWGLARPPFGPEEAVDAAQLEGRTVYLVAGEAVAFDHEGVPVPTVRSLLAWGATRRRVTVDMGAVRFVTNGADVMTPGIVAADPAIAEGDAVWVAEERHGKALAVGVALLAGPALEAGTQGKGVRSLHFLGDRVWDLGREESKDNA